MQRIDSQIGGSDTRFPRRRGDGRRSPNDNSRRRKRIRRKVVIADADRPTSQKFRSAKSSLLRFERQHETLPAQKGPTAPSLRGNAVKARCRCGRIPWMVFISARRSVAAAGVIYHLYYSSIDNAERTTIADRTSESCFSHEKSCNTTPPGN